MGEAKYILKCALKCPCVTCKGPRKMHKWWELGGGETEGWGGGLAGAPGEGETPLPLRDSWLEFAVGSRGVPSMVKLFSSSEVRISFTAAWAGEGQCAQHRSYSVVTVVTMVMAVMLSL